MQRSEWMPDRGFVTCLKAEQREAAAQAHLIYLMRRSASRLLVPVGGVLSWVFDRVDGTYLVLLLAGLLSTAISVALRQWLDVPSAVLVIANVMATVLTVFIQWSHE